MRFPTFEEDIHKVVKTIPKGRVMTYKEVAERVGRPFAFRAVGNILNKNKDPKVPCHRVIRSDGKIGGYNGFQGKKEKLLKEEGYISKRT
ncbi:MAG: O6-methylguanine-DNA--protein-cysteine methyltransferase [Parcubacteria group bacterium]|nr:O6-methylguanine-DNA--protein-cysteine methyltransferase [Parcubacteria group bacterium]